MKSSLPKKEELTRKLLHFLWIFLALGAWWALSRYGKGMVLFFLVEALGALLLFDFVRVEWKWPWLQGLIRKEERGMFCGATTGMLGVVLVFALVNPFIACLATLFMGIGDLTACWVRLYVGKNIFLKKTWEDFLVG